MMSQIQSGKALEYGMVYEISNRFSCPIIENKSLDVAKKYFNKMSKEERENILKSSHEIFNFLIVHDSRLCDSNYEVSIQPDKSGMNGDVRDVIVKDIDKGMR